MNLLKFVTAHPCLVDCVDYCVERENCFNIISETIEYGHMNHAIFLRDIGVKIGKNNFRDNAVLRAHRKESLKSVEKLCKAKHISASVSYDCIEIIDTDEPTGSYESVLYDCWIDDANNVNFDSGKQASFPTEASAIEYALTSDVR